MKILLAINTGADVPEREDQLFKKLGDTVISILKEHGARAHVTVGTDVPPPAKLLKPKIKLGVN